MPSINSPWWKTSSSYGCATTENMPKGDILKVSMSEGVKKNTLDKINRTAGYSTKMTAEDTETQE